MKIYIFVVNFVVNSSIASYRKGGEGWDGECSDPALLRHGTEVNHVQFPLLRSRWWLLLGIMFKRVLRLLEMMPEAVFQTFCIFPSVELPTHEICCRPLEDSPIRESTPRIFEQVWSDSDDRRSVGEALIISLKLRLSVIISWGSLVAKVPPGVSEVRLFLAEKQETGHREESSQQMVAFYILVFVGNIRRFPFCWTSSHSLTPHRHHYK